MLPHAAHCARKSAITALQSRSAQTFRAFYATIRSLRQVPTAPDVDDVDVPDNDFIVSILRANPSLRDTKSYLASFGPRPVRAADKPKPPPAASPATDAIPVAAEAHPPDIAQQTTAEAHVQQREVVAAILNPVYRRTALVKAQGPFTDRQLDSIARGMVYLEKLGLVSVIVVENDRLPRGADGERARIIEETMRVVSALEKQGARARPVLGAVVRLGPKPGDEEGDPEIPVPEAHTFPADLVHIRSALRAGEIPVLPPMALDSFCRSVRVDANDVIAALTRGMVEAAAEEKQAEAAAAAATTTEHVENPTMPHEDVDLTPLRLMIINKEGGVPSYARAGLPHLLVNMTSEYSFVKDTFDPRWTASHPSALANLSLARTCLSYMPRTSSAIMVSHRSPSSLIASLITNKPAVSSSLPHALLQGNRRLEPHTPTILRHGLDVRVIRSARELDRPKLQALLEQSFGRTLDAAPFWARLDAALDFAIVAGDYAGAAIVTSERGADGGAPITYLDKFAVLPRHQGDGTVDFLWVALHDESYGLGLPYAVNPNGGKQGRGEGADLVWRSRADNPVNKWYFERASGHLRAGDWVLFWCDAERRLQTEEGRRASAGLSFLEYWEQGRLAAWSDAVFKIPSSWKK